MPRAIHSTPERVVARTEITIEPLDGMIFRAGAELKAAPLARRSAVARNASLDFSSRPKSRSAKRFEGAVSMATGLYPVPPAAGLQFLRGWELIQVCLGANEVIFGFVQPGRISIFGAYEHLTRAGLRYRPDPAAAPPVPVYLHELCGQTIVAVEPDVAADTLTLIFSEGSEVRILSEGKQYERAVISKSEDRDRPEDAIVF